MNKYRANLLLAALILFSSYYCHGANIGNYYFKQVNIEQGLSQSSVTSILRDHEGVLWIGTRSGLNTLNRNELKSYFSEKDNSESLPGNFIYHICEDSLKNIWVSTNSGVVRYHNTNDAVYNIISEPVFSSAKVSGGILFGGRKVIYKYSYETNSITNIYFKNIEEFNNSEEFDIIDMVRKDSNTIIIGTREKGLLSLDLTFLKTEKIPTRPLPAMLSMTSDSYGNIYLSLYKKGVFCFDMTGKEIAHFTTGSSGLCNDIILDIIERDGEIWMASDGGGISVFNPRNNTFSTIHHIPGDVSSLPVNSITVLYNDPDNNLWAGSVRGGLLGIKETFMRVYKDVALGSTNGLSDKTVISLFEDDQKMLWIGTDGGGLNRYNPSTDEFKHFPQTYGDKIVSITDLSKTQLLISAYGKGVFTVDKSSGRYTPFTIINNEVNEKECFSGFIPFLHRVGRDKIYILSRKAMVYYPEQKKFSYIKFDDQTINASAMSLEYSDNVTSFFVKRNAIFEVRQKDDSLRVLFTADQSEVINTLCYDGRGRLWIGSNAGLSYLERDGKELNRIETSLFTNVRELFLDKSGRLWIGAHDMLFTYIISDNRFIIWGESDGFSSNETLNMYQRQSATDKIYLGGTSGLIVIDENISMDESSRPTVRLGEVILNGKLLSRKKTSPENTLSVPWNYTSLSVKVNINEKDVFHQTLFRYNIEGLNNQYIETYDHTLNLPHLQSGRYVVKVSCITKSGEWIDPVTVAEITILTPWHKSWWFIASIILFVSMIVLYLFYSMIIRKERKLRWEMKLYEQSVNEEKIRFLINISHELRTPLSLIYAPLRRLIDKGSTGDETMDTQLSNIFKQTSRMRDIINMVLDLNKTGNEYENLKRQPHSLNEWVGKVIEDFKPELSYKHINIVFDMDSDIDKIWYDSSKCRIVLSNLLMNALKFSGEHTQITVSTKTDNDFVKISVSDQGIGLDATDQKKLFKRFYQGGHGKKGSGIGLSYAKSIVEKHGGGIGAYNNCGADCDDVLTGATFYFTLPIMEVEEYGIDQTEFTNSITQTCDMPSTYCISPESADFKIEDKSVLIVDDNDDFRDFLHSSLRESFKNVFVAADGVEAIRLIESKSPDIVVSDVMMPNMNGYELCRYIKNTIEISHIPVMLLTARSDSESTYVGYKLGADAYLAKPFEVKTLIAVAKNLLSGQEKIKERYKHINNKPSPEESTFSSADERFVIKINDLINENINNPALDVLFLADKLAMSRASLYSKFKVLFDMGVNDYINKLRIEKATSLLLNSDLNISDIAYETGFTYQRYFSTIFRKATGTTPSKFRDDNKKDQR